MAGKSVIRQGDFLNAQFVCEFFFTFGGSFWQKDSLLQYTMTLLQGPKDPVLPALIYNLCFLGKHYIYIYC